MITVNQLVKRYDGNPGAPSRIDYIRYSDLAVFGRPARLLYCGQVRGPERRNRKFNSLYLI
jgi:hypothetical protein